MITTTRSMSSRTSRPVSLLVKLTAPLGAAALCSMIYLAYTLGVFHENNARLSDIRDVEIPTLASVAKNIAALDKVTDALSSAESTNERETLQDAKDQARAVGDAFAELEAVDAPQAAAVRRLRAEFDRYFADAYAVSAASLGPKHAAPPGLIGAMDDELAAFRRDLGAFRDGTEQRLADALALSIRDSNRATIAGIAIAGTGLTACLLFGLMAAFAATRQVETLAEAFKDIADGGEALNRRIAVTSRDELGRLSTGFNAFVDKYQAMAAQLFRVEQDNRKLGMAVSQSSNGVVVTDAAGRIEFANDAFVVEAGVSSDRLMGRDLIDLTAGATARETLVQLTQALKAGVSWHGALTRSTADGEVHTSLTRVSPIREPNGRIRQHLHVRRDVTEELRAAAELQMYREKLEEMVAERTALLERALREAEAANRAKSMSLANISHEMRTPLTAIMGFSQLLESSCADSLEKERLRKIRTAGGHLLAVINDVLDISKIEAGRFTLDEEAVSVASIFDQVSALVADRAREKGLALRFSVDPAVPEMLRGDPVRLAQIVLNLVGNAVKFTESGSVSTEAELVENDEGSVVLRVKVTDTGPGIPPDQQQLIFRAFEQGDSSATRRYGGTGLGLAICSRLAGLMSGAIGVQSCPGSGSLFWFTARLRHAAPASQTTLNRGMRSTAETTIARRRFAPRVLVAEDNEVNQEVITEWLRGLGAEVDVAADGRAAVSMALRNDYQLILMDMQMPVMDGLSATREIRAIPGKGSVPIVAITANAYAEDRARCLAAGMNDHLRKPIEPETFYRVLIRWLKERPAKDEPQAAQVA